MKRKEWKLYKIYMDDDFVSLGYITENNKWNGWECPIFTEEQIQIQHNTLEWFNFETLEFKFEWSGIKYYSYDGYTFDKEDLYP